MYRRLASAVRSNYSQRQIMPILRGYKQPLSAQLSVFLGISESELKSMIEGFSSECILQDQDQDQKVMEFNISQQLHVKYQLLEKVCDQLMVHIPNPVLGELTTPNALLEYLLGQKKKIQAKIEKDTLVLPENVSVLTEAPSKSDPRPKSKIRRMRKQEIASGSV
jgi:hypothetical protein